MCVCFRVCECPSCFVDVSSIGRGVTGYFIGPVALIDSPVPLTRLESTSRVGFGSPFVRRASSIFLFTRTIATVLFALKILMGIKRKTYTAGFDLAFFSCSRRQSNIATHYTTVVLRCSSTVSDQCFGTVVNIAVCKLRLMVQYNPDSLIDSRVTLL